MIFIAFAFSKFSSVHFYNHWRRHFLRLPFNKAIPQDERHLEAFYLILGKPQMHACKRAEGGPWGPQKQRQGSGQEGSDGMRGSPASCSGGTAPLFPVQTCLLPMVLGTVTSGLCSQKYPFLRAYFQGRPWQPSLSISPECSRLPTLRYLGWKGPYEVNQHSPEIRETEAHRRCPTSPTNGRLSPLSIRRLHPAQPSASFSKMSTLAAPINQVLEDDTAQALSWDDTKQGNWELNQEKCFGKSRAGLRSNEVLLGSRIFSLNECSKRSPEPH